MDSVSMPRSRPMTMRMPDSMSSALMPFFDQKASTSALSSM